MYGKSATNKWKKGNVLVRKGAAETAARRGEARQNIPCHMLTAVSTGGSRGRHRALTGVLREQAGQKAQAKRLEFVVDVQSPVPDSPGHALCPGGMIWSDGDLDAI